MDRVTAIRQLEQAHHKCFVCIFVCINVLNLMSEEEEKHTSPIYLSSNDVEFVLLMLSSVDSREQKYKNNLNYGSIYAQCVCVCKPSAFFRLLISLSLSSRGQDQSKNLRGLKLSLFKMTTRFAYFHRRLFFAFISFSPFIFIIEMFDGTQTNLTFRCRVSLLICFFFLVRPALFSHPLCEYLI